MSSYLRDDDVEIGEQTPLLQQRTTTAEDDMVLQDMKAESLKERAVTATAFVGFFSSITSIILEAAAHPSVWVSGILGLVIAPYSALQQKKLTHVEALQQTNQVLEVEVENLEAENARLKQTIQEMEESVLNLQAMEETLECLQATQGQSIDELERQLQESKDILAGMHKSVKADLLQNLITVMLGCDQDNDMILSNVEIDELIAKLESIHGVQLKENLLRQKIVDYGRSLAAVMEVTRHLLCGEDIPQDQNIFSFIEEEEGDNENPA